MLKSFVSREKACAKDFCEGFLNKKFTAKAKAVANFFPKCTSTLTVLAGLTFAGKGFKLYLLLLRF